MFAMVKRKRIFVLDDDAGVLTAVERVLKLHGFDAQLFDTVDEFLDGTRFDQASCLVLDININGYCGIELSRRLTRSGVTLPVIFMTGAANEDTRRQAFEASCTAYLVKPFRARDLVEAIEHASSCRAAS
jgi:FixJ family two-component response regulator